MDWEIGVHEAIPLGQEVSFGTLAALSYAIVMAAYAGPFGQGSAFVAQDACSTPFSMTCRATPASLRPRRRTCNSVRAVPGRRSARPR